MMYSIADIKKMTRDTIKTENEKNRKTVYDNSDKGFSLVEVVVSMAILAILTLMLLNYFGSSVSHNVQMSKNQKATLFAQETMEELKAQDTLIKKDENTGEYTVPYLTAKNFSVEENTLNIEDSTTGKEKGVGKVKLIGKADEIGKNYDEVVTVSSDKKVQDASNKECGFNNANSGLSIDNGQDDEAFAHFKMKYMAECDNANVAASLSDENLKERIQREIVIEIDNSLTDANIISVKYKYTYNAKSGDAPSYSVPDYEVYIIKEQRVMKKDREIEIYLLYHTFNELCQSKSPNLQHHLIQNMDFIYCVKIKRTREIQLH